jgi:hypothetical protein
VDALEIERFEFPRADVSGTPGFDLAELLPQGDLLSVRCPGSGAAPAVPGVAAAAASPSAEPLPEAVSGLARDAAYAARRPAGSDRLDPSRRRELVVAIDGSASNAALLNDGSGQALLEVLVGVNSVAGARSEIPLWLMGSEPQQVSSMTASTVDGLWARLFAGRRTTDVAALSPVVDTLPASDNVVQLVVVCDGPLADAEATVERLKARAAAGQRVSCHVLAVAVGASAQPWRDELAPLRRWASEGLFTLSTVEPTGPTAGLASTLADPDRLRDAISALPLWRTV